MIPAFEHRKAYAYARARGLFRAIRARTQGWYPATTSQLNNCLF